MITTYENAQAAVLGAVLLGASLDRLTVDHGLRPEHFAGRNRTLFEAMLAVHDAGDPLDRTVIAERMGGTVEDVAALDAVATVPDLAAVDAYCRIVRKEAAWRARATLLGELGLAVECRNQDAFDAHLAALHDTGATSTVGAATTESVGLEFLDWMADDTAGASIPTPWPQVNRMLGGGIRGGNTYVLASWAHQGKSVFVDQVAESAGLGGAAAVVFINEMARPERVARQVSRMTGIPVGKLLARDLDDDQWRLTLNAAKRLPYVFEPVAGKSAADIAHHVRRHRPDVWAVDLVTRIPARDTRDWDAISGALADVALQTHTAGLLVCQLNRERDTGAKKPDPVLRDLRNTGAWEQDHSHVLFLHREQESMDGGLVETLDDGYVRFEKNRSTGQMGAVPLRLDRRRMRFVEAPRMAVAA